MRLLDLLAFKYVIGHLGSFLRCSDVSDTMREPHQLEPFRTPWRCWRSSRAQPGWPLCVL